MADSKDYIVRYNIQTNVTDAINGLKSIASIANDFEAPMKELQTAIKQVADSAYMLKQNANISFAPKIDIGGFENQLKQMVVSVRNAASEMHTAIYQAFNAGPVAKNTLQKSINEATKGTRSVKSIKSEIEALNKELDGLLGTRKKNKKGQNVRERDGSIQMAKNANMSERVLELEARKKSIQNILKDRKEELEYVEKLERKSEELSKTVKKVAKPSPVSSVSGAVKSTNVTPATIKAWKDAFGNAKNKILTVNIRGYAGGKDGALSVISQVQTQLNNLKANAEKLFTIDVFGRLKSIEPMAKPPVIPIIGELTQIQQKTKGAIPVNVKMVSDQLATSGKSGNKGASKAAIPISGKIDRAGIIEQIKKIPKQTIPLYMKLSWQNGAIGKQEQLKKLHASIPPIKLNLDITGAIAKLEEFIAIVRQNGVQNITLNAAGNASYMNSQMQSGSSASVASGTRSGKILTANDKYAKQKEDALKNEAKKRADSRFMTQKAHEYNKKEQSWRSYQQSLYDRLFGLSPIGKDWVYTEQQKRAAELQTMAQDARSVFAKQTPYELAQENARKEAYAKSLAKRKADSERSIAAHQRRADILKGNLHNAILPHVANLEQLKMVSKYRKLFGKYWTANGNQQLSDIERHQLLDNVSSEMRKRGISVPFQMKNEMNRLESSVMQEWQRDYDERRRKSSAESIAKHQKRADEMRNKARRRIMPFTKNNSEVAESIVKYRKYFTEARRVLRFSPKKDIGRDRSVKDLLSHVVRSMKSDNVQVPSWITKEINNRQKSIDARNAREVAKYNRVQEENRAKLFSEQTKRANALRNNAFNAMLPFASSKEQANMLVKYRRHFRNAAKALNIDPKGQLSDADKLSYLNEVSRQMQKSNVAVPWQLQSMMNKLQGTLDKEPAQKRTSSGARRSFNKDMPFFNRARKWGYPFTGTTSFGERTPMAVEMAKGMGVGYAIGGAMSAIGDSFTQAVDYQNVMRTTQSILQNGTDSYNFDSYKNMERIVRNVGIKTKFSAPEVAGAAKFLAMAGYDINAINHSIRPIADLALIGDTDLAETADKMTNIMTTFNIKPEQMRAAANIMATTAMRSNTDLMMLAESAKYGGGVAQMYGGKDPNLFADTMALFGVMGNAGIQASSAGTALRMMYQNVFKPNKNQADVLKMMDKEYGIKTRNDDNSYRSMSSILVEMAQRIPENKMAEIVGSLFRITAQPGASSALMAAAGGDKNIANEIAAGSDYLSSMMSSKSGLSSLVSLMIANRNSGNSNISGKIAEEKQNTIQGLWAQVTSTFTEGILRAMESRQGGFENILKQLRDYFAKPETLVMMQNFIDMIIEIGKVMAWFAKIWAELYNSAPGLVKTWITMQMFFTQFGTLLSPVISLIGAFSRLKELIMGMAKVSAIASAPSVSKGVVGALAAGFGTSNGGASHKIYGNAAARANKALSENMILASELALSGAQKEDIVEILNKDTRDHYAQVRKRANRIYGKNRAGRIITEAWNISSIGISAGSIIATLKSSFFNLLTGVAKAFVTMVNPITVAIAAIGGLGFSIYKFVQFVKGNTNEQIAAQKQLAEASSEATRSMIENRKWYKEKLQKYSDNVFVNGIEKSQTELEYEERAKRFQESNADLMLDLSKNASHKGINLHLESWRKRMNDPLYRLALGSDYDNYVGNGLLENKSTSLKSPSDNYNKVYEAFFSAKALAVNVRNKQIQAALRTSLIDTPEIIQAASKIEDLYELHLNNKLSYEDYNKKGKEIIDNVANINDSTLKPSWGISQSEFNKIQNPAVYRESVLGAYNYLNAILKAENGTITAKTKAYSDLNKGIDAFTDKWCTAISNIIEDCTVTLNTSAGKANVIFSSLSGNTVRDQVYKQTGYKASYEDVVNSAIARYEKLVNIGAIPKTEEAAKRLVYGWVHADNITGEDAKSYYHNYLKQDGLLKRNIKTAEDYASILTGGDNILVDGKTLTPAALRVSLRNDIIDRKIKELFGENTKTVTQTLVNNQTPVIDNKDVNNNITKQDDYASKYQNSESNNTYISININELVHFKDTKIESNASEQEIISSMEDKIVNAVYELFATASNMAQKSFNLS